MTPQPASAAVVIGASAGALEALSAVLPKLPAGFPRSVLLVVHIPPAAGNLLPELLQAKCKLAVQEASDKEPALPGHLYVAAPDYHLQVEADGYISLSNEEPVYFSRPSIDVLFETAADAYGERLVGVILTGANEDGARGLRAVLDAGGTALVQQPEGAYATLMPRSAIEACPEAQVMELGRIAQYLQELAA